MKKLLFVALIGLASAVSSARELSNLKKGCTAHFYLTVHCEGHPDVVLYVTRTEATCAEAMADAQAIGHQMAQALYN